ncbi:MAG: hypothetical protein GWN01_15950 [Nitrosopumilaceae archaeon]|nr:hypothetical protein [Nitrosopumilaceae archaeon]NIU02330.1 hypothetical protein [Nitrosopumilaceae archaeon]NIU88785.1 hypothetical protein [Nitrosopumilaceae archaeon]NIV66912.1 hypothetical protein [Nitrosopumilaceae archaeon]NIX62931.1 hypothetical protein [Nitrosopumilaceae archaeon]
MIDGLFLKGVLLAASLLVVFFPTMAFSETGQFPIDEYEVQYKVDGGTLETMVLETDLAELIITIESTDDGLLEITIPRAVLDARFEGQDDIFFVIVDGFETDYLEVATSANSRTLAIPFFVGDSTIEILGTNALSVFEVPTEEAVIPEWVRNNALWWSDGMIQDKDFLLGIQYLIEEGIMVVPADATEGTASFVPNWIKDTAGWWATGKITDQDFVNGIKWLIEHGIISV